MNKIAINLLPPEVILQRKQSSKLSLVNKLSIVALTTLVFFTSATLALRLMQNTQLSKAKQGLVYAEGLVSGLKGKEDRLAMVKSHLVAIEGLQGLDTKRKAMFNLVVFLTPADITILDASVDKNGNMAITIISPSLVAIDTLISNLGDREKNSDLISKVDLEGLSIGRDFLYRLSLKITAK